MNIYIDEEFRCHTEDDGTMKAFETDAFDGKCKRYIEGYRLIPDDESWTREDGVTFKGEMIAPWRPHDVLEELQAQHEETQVQMADMKAALSVLGVSQ